MESVLFEGGATIAVVGCGKSSKSLGQMFLMNFMRHDLFDYNLPVKAILVNNKDANMKQVRNFIRGNLKSFATNLGNSRRDRAKRAKIEEFFRENRIREAYLDDIKKDADLIQVSYDSGFNEPEINASSRFIVYNRNIQAMLSRFKDTEALIETLGPARGHKLVITNPVDYISHFSTRHLMKKRLLQEDLRDESLYFLSQETDKREWKFNEKLTGIPGRYLVRALKNLDPKYLEFLKASWSGFSLPDVARQQDIVKEIIEEEIRSDKRMTGCNPKINFDTFYIGEHGAISESVLSCIRLVGRGVPRDMEFPFSEGSRLHHRRKEISSKVRRYTAEQYNKFHNWINPNVTPSILEITRRALLQDKITSACVYHEDSSENPMRLTLPAQYFTYKWEGLPTIGSGVPESLQNNSGTLDKECQYQERRKSKKVFLFDDEERGRFNEIISDIQNIIEKGERNETISRSGLPLINAYDTILAVQDLGGDTKGRILLTTYKGIGSPTGTIDIHRKIGRLLGEGNTVIAYLIEGSSKRLVRFKLGDEFLLKNAYNLNGTENNGEICAEEEDISFRVKELQKLPGISIPKGEDPEWMGVQDGHLYVHYGRKIEKRDIDSFELAAKMSLEDDLKGSQAVGTDPRGNVYLLDEVKNVIHMLDSSLEKVDDFGIELKEDRIDTNKSQEYNTKFIEFDNRYYMFCSVNGSARILCWDVTEPDNPSQIDLENKSQRKKVIFAPGVYRNPIEGTDTLYIARVNIDENGMNYLEIDFYRAGEDSSLEKTSESKSYEYSDINLNNPSEFVDIKTNGNYVVVANHNYLLARHIHKKDWHKWIDTRAEEEKDQTVNFRFMRDFDILTIGGK